MSHKGSNASNIKDFNGDSSESSEKEDADKKARVAQLENEIAYQKSVLLTLRTRMVSYANNTNPFYLSMSKSRNYCIEATEELYKLTGMHCIKSDANTLICQYRVGSKVTSADVYIVEILINNGQYQLGRWVMPMSINLRNIVLEYPITDWNDLKSFLKRCKHYVDCYISRRDQYCEFKDFLSDTKNCVLDTNLGNTLVILHMSGVKLINSEITYNVSVYMGYESDRAIPNWLTVEPAMGFSLWPEPLVYQFKKYFKPFMKHNLRGGFEKVISDTRYFQWTQISNNDFEMEEFLQEFEEKNDLRRNTDKKKSKKNMKHSRHNTSIDSEERSKISISLPSDEEEQEKEEVAAKPLKPGRKVNSKKTKQVTGAKTRRQSKIKDGGQIISKAETRGVNLKKMFNVKETDIIDENKNVVERETIHEQLGVQEKSSKDEYLKENSTEMKNMVAGTLKERLNRRQRKKSEQNDTTEQINNSREMDNSRKAENPLGEQNLKQRLNTKQRNKSASNKTTEVTEISREKENPKEPEDLAEEENSMSRLNERQRKELEQKETTEQTDTSSESIYSKEKEIPVEVANLKQRLSTRLRNKSLLNKTTEVMKISREKDNPKEPEDLAEEENSMPRLNERQRKELKEKETTEQMDTSCESIYSEETEISVEVANLKKRVYTRERKKSVRNNVAEVMNNSRKSNSPKESVVSNESEECNLSHDGSEETFVWRGKNDDLTDTTKSTQTRKTLKKLQNTPKPKDPGLSTNSQKKSHDETAARTPRKSRTGNVDQLSNLAKRQLIARETKDRSGQEDIENVTTTLLDDVATNDVTQQNCKNDTRQSFISKNNPHTSKIKSIRRPSLNRKGTGNAYSNEVVNSTPISSNLPPKSKFSQLLEISEILPSTSNSKLKGNLTSTEDGSSKKKIGKQKLRVSFCSEDDPDEDIEEVKEVLKDIEEFIAESKSNVKPKTTRNVWKNTEGRKKKR